MFFTCFRAFWAFFKNLLRGWDPGGPLPPCWDKFPTLTVFIFWRLPLGGGIGHSIPQSLLYRLYWNRSPPSLTDICVRADTEAGLRRGCLFSVSFKLYVAVYVLKSSPRPCPASVSALTHMSAREWGDLFPSSPCKWTTRIVMPAICLQCTMWCLRT